MNSFSPALNLGARKVKGLIKLFGGLAAPFYFTDVVVAEGQPMKFHAATADKMVPLAGTDAAACCGLAMQATYDETAFAELKGYHFANSTKQRLDGMPIGLLTGTGYALTNCYQGVVAWGNVAYYDSANKKLTGTVGTANDKLPIIFEGAGTTGDTMVRIRFSFPLNV